MKILWSGICLVVLLDTMTDLVIAKKIQAVSSVEFNLFHYSLS